MNKSSSCSLCSSAVGGVCVLGFDCSRRGVVASLLLSFVLPWGCDAEHVFLCLFAMCIFPLVSCPPFESGCLFSYCWVMSSLFILETVLYQICLLQIFSPSLWLILSFSWHCFYGAEVFNFNEVQLINSSFHGCVFGVVSLPHPRSCRFSPLLSFRSFIVVCLTFKSGIHFELIFVKGIRSVSTLFVYLFFTCRCPVVPAPCVEKTVFAPLYHLCSFVKDCLTIFMWFCFCSGLSILFLFSISSYPLVSATLS